jgi:hypothetical protein
MRNIFFISLQRVGSNYVEVVLNKNTEELAFRGYLLEVSKHFLPKRIEVFETTKIQQDDFIIIVKNPYMWVESVCWNTEMSKETQKELWFGDFEDYKVQHNADLNGYNLNNLVNMYKDFYKKWFEFSKDNNIQTVKYEDFLYKDKAEEVCRNIVSEIGHGQVKSNFKLHHKPIRFSMGFTKEDFEYYKNEKPTKISKVHIDTINKILGSDFIEELGYEVIS